MNWDYKRNGEYGEYGNQRIWKVRGWELDRRSGLNKLTWKKGQPSKLPWKIEKGNKYIDIYILCIKKCRVSKICRAVFRLNIRIFKRFIC